MHTPSRKRSTRKRSFLLFELMVSLALIALCLFPLIKTLAGVRQSEMKEMVEMQLWNHSQHAFCQIKERIFEQEYTWKELVNGVSGTLDPFTVVTGPKTKRDFLCKYTISKHSYFRKKSFKKHGMAVTIDITFEGRDDPFQRTLYLEQEVES